MVCTCCSQFVKKKGEVLHSALIAFCVSGFGFEKVQIPFTALLFLSFTSNGQYLPLHPFFPLFIGFSVFLPLSFSPFLSRFVAANPYLRP